MSSLRASRPAGGIGDELDRHYIVGGLACMAVILVACGLFFNRANVDVWSAVVVVLFLLFISVPLFRLISVLDDAPWMFKLLYFGLIAKLIMSMVRYWVIFKAYDGQGDAGVYIETGVEYARRWRAGAPLHPIERIEHFPVEAQRVGDFTGWMAIVVGASRYSIFFLYSYICYLGQVLMVRAFHVAIPEGDDKRYAWLVLFLPSLMFWPSSVGKEALMMGIIGLLGYGAGLLLAPKPRLHGIVYFVIGIGLAILIRPHIALMGVGGMALALTVGALGRGEANTASSRAIRIVGLIAVLSLAGAATTAASGLFNQDAGQDSKLSVANLSSVSAQTSIGGSQFKPITAQNPLLLPAAVVSVSIRPFPWEAHSLTSFIAAGEGVLLIALVYFARRRILVMFKLLVKRPFLVFCAAFVLAFVVAFSFVANFGLLARQRTLMVPTLVVFLAGASAVAAKTTDEDDDAPVEEVTSSGSLAVAVSRPRTFGGTTQT